MFMKLPEIYVSVAPTFYVNSAFYPSGVGKSSTSL